MSKHRGLNRSSFRITGGWPLIMLACLVMFIDTVGFGVVVPVLPNYAKNLGVSDFQLGVLFATYAIALLLGAVPIGILSDRLGRKPFVLFGMFAMSGAFIFYALANTYFLLIVARILDGLTAAATWTAALALVGDRIDESEMGEKMGYLMGVMAVGGIAGPVVGGLLSDAAGYRAPFYTIAGACFVAGVMALFLKEDRALLQETRASLGRMLKPILKNRGIIVACLVTVITTMGIGLLEPTFPLYLEEKFSMSRTGIGIIFGVMMVFYGLASPLVGRISDRIGRREPIVVGLISTAAIAPFLAVFGNVAVLYVLMGILGVTFTLLGTPTLPLVTDALPEVAGGEAVPMGTAFGLLNFFWSLGYALGPLIGGAIMGWLGLLAALVFCSGLMVITTFIVIFFLERGM